MAEAASAAASVATTSLAIFDRFYKPFKEAANVGEKIRSMESSKAHIDEAIAKFKTDEWYRLGSQAWIRDIQGIKLRVEDTAEFYKAEVAGDTGSCEGWLAKPLHEAKSVLWGSKKKLVGYLDEIEKLTELAKENYVRYNQGQQTGQTTPRVDDNHHPGVNKPVGLEKPIAELVDMLSDATLRVVAICGSDDSPNIAKEGYDQVTEEFVCAAWVTASRDGQKKLLQDILHQLPQSSNHQVSQDLCKLKADLKGSLTNKRYIIGINGLDTTDYWNYLMDAFPDNLNSSRIIVTMAKEEIAQVCRRNCTLTLKAPKAEQLVQTLRDATLLRVVAISGANVTQKSVDAYDEVKDKEHFSCKAWVDASDGDEEMLLKSILDNLKVAHQESQDLTGLRQSLRHFLAGKRYIIGISGLKTADYWNDLINAFPDDQISSRLIVTTTKKEIAQACRKNCKLYSYKEPKAELVKILSSDERSERRVISICGPGGCGKSVLAKLAYEKVKKEFQCCARSMKTGNKLELLRDILDQLGVGESQLKSKTANKLGDELHKLLTGKKYIILMDGIETEDCWSEVKGACPDEKIKSRIIVTTTDKYIASMCKSLVYPVYMMQQALNKSSLLELLVTEVFGKDDYKSRRNVTVILETCEYSPLAIDAIVLHMKGDQSKKDWSKSEECKKLSKELGLLLNESDLFGRMRSVLDRSYNSLNKKAKACLLSLSSYPIDLDIDNDNVINDHIIKVKPLIRRLLAEDEISPADAMLKDFFNPLVQQGFIIPTEYSINGRMKTFRVNRMLPEFIKEKGKRELHRVTRIDDIQQGQQVEQGYDITRLYISNHSSSESSKEKVDLSRVRLLICNKEANEAIQSSHFLDFNSYKFLRVLVLENCGNMKDGKIRSVCSLSLLRYLSIRGSKGVTKFPDNIEKMKRLETLDLRDTMVEELLIEVILLPKLAHLFGKFKIICKKGIIGRILEKMMPEKPDSNTFSDKLHTLAGFLAYESPDFAESLPKMLKLLNKVKIIRRVEEIDPHNTEKSVIESHIISSLKECFECNSDDSKLRSLTFDFGGHDLEFLSGIIKHPSFLDSLKLFGKLTVLPSWIASCGSLTELVLSGTNIGRLSDLQGMENLLYLKLTEESLVDSSDANEEYTWSRGWFKSLQRLCLKFSKLPNIVIQEGAMKNLKYLQVSCTELCGFDGIKNLRSLEEFIFDCDDSSKMSNDLLNQVEMLPSRPRIGGSALRRQKIGKYKKFRKPS